MELNRKSAAIMAILCIASFSIGIAAKTRWLEAEAPSEKRVTGIGGVFFKANNPKMLKEWYEKHLGMKMDAYGTNFEWRQGTDSSKKGFTQWSVFSNKTTYFEPSKKDCMINYRVENLDRLYRELQAEHVQIVDKVETFEYGKFLHIIDLEGNKIELWEPIDESYDKAVVGRVK